MADAVSEYRILRKLKMETPNVTGSRKNTIKKLEYERLIWILLID